MKKEIVHKGTLNRRVELFKKQDTNNAASERIHSEVLIGKIWVNRDDVSGDEDDEDGQIKSLAVCKFITAYSKDLFKNGAKYFIRDVDGDYEINALAIIGRNRFLELKASRRGK